MDSVQSIEFVVGAEKRLVDILNENEVMPLLQSALQAGLSAVALLDVADFPLWSCGEDPVVFARAAACGYQVESCPLFLEGEPVGRLCFALADDDRLLLKTTARVVAGAVGTIMTANLKRMLTTEIHTRVVNQSYEELLETNRKLSLSEKKYRDLAENLEVLVQERTSALKRTYAKLIQQEKMASIGQLAAGIAHEINNPLGFILSNLQTLQKYAGRFAEMLAFFRSEVGKNTAAGELKPAAEEKWQKLKLDYILADLPELLGQSIAGADRVRKIVADLRGFSHIDDADAGLVDVNVEIDRTLSVLAHEIPPCARIVREFAALPAIAGRPALLCQAFLNIIRNALQARPEGLVLTIRSEFAAGLARLTFADNGPGLAGDIKSRIFEPFFTTRDVGQGMGMGLTAVYDIVTGCGGTIEVETAPGRGTSFILQLPAGR